MLLPIASVFVACGKDDGYNLNNLKTDFYNTVQENDNLKLDGNRIVFDYSSHEHLNNTISSTYPYTELQNYNTLFYNLMAFAYDYIEVCSNNEAIDNKEIKEELENKLKNLKKSISDVDDSVNMLAEVVNVSSNNVLENICLTRYENLLETYDAMFENAVNFNNALEELYFNQILKDGNPDVFKVFVEDFDANVVINKLDARLKYQISNLTQSYVEMCIDGGKLAEEIASTSAVVDLSKYNYQTNIDAINKLIDEQVAAEKANNTANKENFYNLAVKAQNIQSILNSDVEKFIKACNKIHYLNVVSSQTPGVHETMCVEIIEGNYHLISTYNQVLVEMLAIITGV